MICLFPAPVHLAAEKKAEFRPMDRWYEVYLGESKVGFAHSTMKLVEGEVRSESIFEMRIKRAGQVIEMKVAERTSESPDGKIIGFSGETLMAGIPILKKGWVENGEIVVREKQFLRETTKRYPLDPQGKMTWGILKLLKEKGFREKGLTYEARVYSPDFGMAKPTRAIIRTLGPAKVSLAEGDIDAFETEIEMVSSVGSLKTSNWLDGEGIAVRTQMQMGGLSIDIRQSSEKRAKAEGELKEDFLLDSVISLGSELPPMARRNVFRLRAKDGNLTGITYEGKTQKIRRGDGRTLEIEVLAEDWKAIRKGKGHPLQVGPEYREANILVDCEDKLVKELAKRAGQGSRSPFETAERLCSFVSRYVSEKNFSVGFASASEVARKREGDCTEHGILLAALGRALGIPSRVATGIVYAKEFKGTKNAMVYHMWTQFYLRGRWVNFDSALRKVRCPADRIIFFVSSMKEDSMVESMLPTSELIGNLSVERIDSP